MSLATRLTSVGVEGSRGEGGTLWRGQSTETESGPPTVEERVEECGRDPRVVQTHDQGAHGTLTVDEFQETPVLPDLLTHPNPLRGLHIPLGVVLGLGTEMDSVRTPEVPCLPGDHRLGRSCPGLHSGDRPSREVSVDPVVRLPLSQRRTTDVDVRGSGTPERVFRSLFRGVTLLEEKRIRCKNSDYWRCRSLRRRILKW